MTEEPDTYWCSLEREFLLICLMQAKAAGTDAERLYLVSGALNAMESMQKWWENVPTFQSPGASSKSTHEEVDIDL